MPPSRCASPTRAPLTSRSTTCSDILPAGTSYVPGSSTFDGLPNFDPTIAGQTLTWASSFPIPANSSKDLTYQAAFPGTGGFYLNSALGHVGTVIIDSTLAVDDSMPAHASVLVSPFAADVSITNVDSPDPLLVGTTLTYTLTVANAGPDSALATAVVDTLPAGVTFVSAVASVGTASETGGIVTANLGDLASGQGGTVTIQVTPTAAATLVDRAYVSSTRPDPAPGNNEATATTIAAFALAPDVQLVKRASAASFGVGQTGDFTLTATNVGSLPTSGGITLRDTLAAGVQYLGTSGAGWSASESAGIVTATYAGALAANDSAAATVQVQFFAAAAPGVTNRAWATTAGDADPTNDGGAVSVTVSGAPDLQLVKRHVGTFASGQAAQWALTATNVGTLPTSAVVTVVDTLPGGATFTTGSGTGWTVNATSGIVTATNPGPIAAGDSAAFTINVTLSPAAVPGITNAAVATTLGDVDPGNDRSVDAVAVTGQPDLQLVKRDGGAFTVGATGTYALTVSNLGLSQTTGAITVRDSLPAGVDYVSASGSGWTITAVPPIVTATYAAALDTPDSAAFAITVRANATGVPSVLNGAVATTAGEMNPADNTASRTTAVSGAPDLALAKRHAGTFTVGVPAQYAIVATNVGNLPTAGTITVTDTLPAGLAFTGGTGAGWSVSAASGIVTATNPGPIAAGDSAQFTVDVSVAGGAVPGVTNTAVAQVAGDLDAANDRAVDPTSVQNLPPVPDVQLVKRTPGAPFTVGGTGTYTLTVTNVGTGPTTGPVTVSDALFAGLQFTSGTGAGWAVGAAGSFVTATYAAAIAPGDSATATLLVHVDAAAAPSIGNLAIAATAGDVDAANDSSRATTAVNSAPDVALAKRHAGVFTVGQPGAYTLAAVNLGNVATTGTVTVLDTLPAGLAFASGAGTGWTVNAAAGIVTATFPAAIAPTDSAVFTVNVSVAGGAVPAVTNTAVAQAAGDVDAGNDRALDPTTVQTPLPVPDLQVVKRHAGSFTAATTGQYAITVTNVGNAATTGAITLTDALPAALTYSTSAGAGWIVGPTTPNVVATYAAALAPGDSTTFTLTVNVLPAAVPQTTNNVAVTTPGDTDPANDQSADPTTVIGAPDLVLAKVHTGNFTLGQNGNYTLRVRNAGVGPTTGTVTVLDSLPAGLSYVSGAGPGWAFANAGGVVTATNPGPIAAGDSLVFTLTVNAGPASLGGVTNVANASTPGESDPTNGRALDPTNVLGVPDLALVKSHTGTFTVGQPAVYAFAIHNVGTAASAGVITVRDTLPAGLTYTSAPAVAGLTVSALGPIVTATTSNAIAVGDSLVYTIVVGVGVAAYPTVQNAAVVTNAGDTNLANNRSVDAPATVQFVSQLALEKSAAPTRAEPADVVTYTLTIANRGVSPVPSVAVRDTLPVGFRYVPGTALVDGNLIANPTGGTGPALEFAVGTVPAQGAVTLRYRALVNTSAVLGDGMNRALALNSGLGIASNRAVAQVDVDGGVFANDGVLVGKVFADCSCDSGRTQGNEEVGVPGVRVYLEDGRSAITDVEGKYHFDVVAPQPPHGEDRPHDAPRGRHVRRGGHARRARPGHALRGHGGRRARARRLRARRLRPRIPRRAHGAARDGRGHGRDPHRPGDAARGHRAGRDARARRRAVRGWPPGRRVHARARPGDARRRKLAHPRSPRRAGPPRGTRSAGAGRALDPDHGRARAGRRPHARPGDGARAGRRPGARDARHGRRSVRRRRPRPEARRHPDDRRQGGHVRARGAVCGRPGPRAGHHRHLVQGQGPCRRPDRTRGRRGGRGADRLRAQAHPWLIAGVLEGPVRRPLGARRRPCARPVARPLQRRLCDHRARERRRHRVVRRARRSVRQGHRR